MNNSTSVTISINPLGLNTGPFNLYSDVDNYASVFGIVTQAQLLVGVTITVPLGTTIIQLVSTGICGTNLYIPVTAASVYPSVTPTISATPSVTPSATPTVTPTRSLTASRPTFSFPAPSPAGNTGGCLTYGTPIVMADKTIKQIQDIKPGDKVLSISSADKFFSTNKFRKSIATVTETYSVFTHEVININNGLLTSSHSHINVIKRDGIWSLKTSIELLVGDIIMDINKKEIEITTIDKLSNSQLVYNISVDKDHIYFANNILTHNKIQYICCTDDPTSNICYWVDIRNLPGATCFSLQKYNCGNCGTSPTGGGGTTGTTTGI